MQVSSGWRFSSRVPFKYLNAFLARVKSVSVGDANLYDKHFVASRSGLTHIVQIQALLFRQRRHQCLCVMQLSNVQAFVNVLGSKIHCEPSSVTIVHNIGTRIPSKLQLPP